jgi:cell division protein FtsW
MKKEGVFGFDIPLAAVALALSLIGLVFIYSASSYTAEVQLGDAFHYIKTQAVALAIGLFAMFGMSFVPLEKLKKLSLTIYVVCLVLLALVFVPVLGVESYGAKRWLNLGFFTVQPSEYAKFGMVMLIAAFMSKRDMTKFRNVLAVLALGGAVCALIIMEPNMSITMCALIVVFLMIFIGGARLRHMILLVIPAVAGAVALIFAEPYRIQRLLAFLDPWSSPLEEGYQLIQSYYALGSGGLFGVGLFNSRQKYMFLPFAESDFIMSIIGEETGLFGVLFIMLLFFVIVYRGVKIARGAEDRFSCYLASGVTAVVAVQSVINIAVVCGAIPPTGLPLPFISAGGSSLVAYMGAVGILLAVSRRSGVFIRPEKFAAEAAREKPRFFLKRQKGEI